MMFYLILHNKITLSLNLYLHMSIPRPQYSCYIYRKTPLKSKMTDRVFIADEIIIPISPEQKTLFLIIFFTSFKANKIVISQPKVRNVQ